MALCRFTPAGTLDTGFAGGAGYVIHHDAAGGNGNDTGNAVALDAAGNIYVAGQSKNGNGWYDMVLWRYTPAGDLDTTFGGGAGYVVHSNAVGGDRDDVGNALSVGADGNIYVAGYSYGGLTSKWDMALWRFTPAGDLDTTFGGGTGYVTHNNSAGGDGEDLGKSVALDASGNIYVTGNSDSVSSGRDMVLWRYTPAGDLDTGFGSGAGFVAYDIGANDAGMAVTLDANSNVFVGGFAGTNGKIVLWRFSPSPDGIGDVCDDDIDGDGLLNSPIK